MHCTGTLQNYARKHKVAIDTLKWDFMVRLDRPSSKAEDGCFVDGLFIDGAAWDHRRENRPCFLNRYCFLSLLCWLCMSRIGNANAMYGSVSTG